MMLVGWTDFKFLTSRTTTCRKVSYLLAQIPKTRSKSKKGSSGESRFSWSPRINLLRACFVNQAFSNYWIVELLIQLYWNLSSLTAQLGLELKTYFNLIIHLNTVHLGVHLTHFNLEGEDDVRFWKLFYVRIVHLIPSRQWALRTAETAKLGIWAPRVLDLCFLYNVHGWIVQIFSRVLWNCEIRREPSCSNPSFLPRMHRIPGKRKEMK